MGDWAGCCWGDYLYAGNGVESGDWAESTLMTKGDVWWPKNTKLILATCILLAWHSFLLAQQSYLLAQDPNLLSW